MRRVTAVLAAALATMAFAAADPPAAEKAPPITTLWAPFGPAPTAPYRARQAFTDLRSRAQAGDAEAAAELGQMYARGGSVGMDIDEAFRWLTKGMDGGSNAARREFGLLLLRLPGPRRDPARAVPLLTQAAEAGDAEAQTALGMLYAWGDGIGRDGAQALAWTRPWIAPVRLNRNPAATLVPAA